MEKLQRSIENYDNSVEKYYPIIPGEIGISLGGSRVTEVPGRGQFVFVRLRSSQSEIIQVFNGKVFPGYGLPVLVKWNNNRYEIVGVDVQRYQQWLADNPHIAKHGATHSMDKEGDRLGTDPVWVYPYQFMPSLVAPFPQSGIQNVYINPLMVQYGGEWKYIGNTGTPSLTAYNPVSGSSIILISLDSVSGNPFLYSTTGTYIPSSTTGTNDLLSYLPSLDFGRYIPLSFVLLASGTSSITWNNLFDIRQFFRNQSTGSSYLSVNGVYPIDTLSIDGATFSNTGTVAFFELVSSGGTGDPVLRFHVGGALETGTSVSQPYLVTDDYTASYVYLYVDYLGVTGTTRADIKKNGISIFTGGYTLDISYNLTGSWVRALPYYTSFVRGDILQLDLLEKATLSREAEVFITPAAGGASGGLTVKEEDENPSVSDVSIIVFPNSRITNDGGGQVTVQFPSELYYVQATGTVSITATTEGTANVVLSGSTGTYDGNPIMLEFYAETARPDSGAANRDINFYIFEDGASLGSVAYMRTPTAGFDNKPLYIKRRLSPSSGSHIYSIRAKVSAGTGAIGAGGGRSGESAPMFLRITRV